MAEKIKKTRPELLRQRRSLAMFKRFLPTLLLKKQQIQMEIQKVRVERARVRGEIDHRIAQIDRWVALFSESIPGPVTRLVKVKDIQRGIKNVAGIDLPILVSVIYEVQPYSLFATPPWVDQGVAFVKALLELREWIKVLMEQERVLQKELRKVTQRVNLFEKIMIPRAIENIRVIRIALGEEQVAGVGRAKIAKAKTQAAAAGGAA
ncbi:MAG: V-type ATP synthase subunit D [Candidatus Ozemobacter sibiricus]|jgi:V/A-type H+-transporting ATPase subunit D|uniref:V-type ATP synthase subunit D n=1 Tax=Candidatus Ozemobacter sibiricus TaxID=2268124 RepID=A0A367ZNK3_9BACT|nr:MAG: V-type ATP synthase subunit D [Candidatus Ozemobacter sibiricus]